jgi:hypothetical protein
MSSITWQTVFTPEFINMALVLLGLIVLDLAFGMAVALKLHVFEWKKIADFYGTTVLPNLLGWITVHVVVSIATALAVSALVDAIKPVLDLGFYGVVMIALIAQVVEKGQAIRTDSPADETKAASKA